MIIVRIGLGITSINGASAYNTTDAVSRTAGSGRDADRQVGITSKSAFQRIRLQFAPPSQASDLPDAELALHDLNLRRDESSRSEEVLAKRQSVSSEGRLSAYSKSSYHPCCRRGPLEIYLVSSRSTTDVHDRSRSATLRIPLHVHR